MRTIDSHTHTFLRGAEDIELMAAAGVDAVVVCAFLPVRPSGPSTLADLFTWLVESETARLAELGLRALPALGVHPRCVPSVGLTEALDALSRRFAEKRAAALGEVGLELATDEEKQVLAPQLALASQAHLPVVLHTPRKDKPRVLRELIQLLTKERFDPSRAVIDHLTPELVPEVLSFGAKAGVTVQPGKVTAEGVRQIYDRHGPGSVLLNSDLAHVAADPLAVPRTARFLERSGVPASDVEKMAHGNAAGLFGGYAPRPLGR